MAPTLVGTPNVKAALGAVNTTLVSDALTVSTGDILVIKLYCGDTGQTITAVTVDGNAATSRAVGTATGYSRTAIYTYTIPSGTTATVTTTYGGTGNAHVMVTEVWRGAQLAASPATNATTTFTSGTGFSGSLTTVAAGSVVSWVAGDWNGNAFGTIGYRSSATTDGATSNQGGNSGDGSSYFAYQTAAVAGAQTFGTTTPAGSKFAAVGIEIQASSIVQQASGTFNGTSFTPTLPGASSASNCVVLIVTGNTTVTTPASWTQRVSNVNEMGHYLYDRAGASITSVAVTNTAGQGMWWIAEIQGGSHVSSSGANNVALNTTYATPTDTPTAGTRIIIASLGGNTSTGPLRTVSGWTNSFIEQVDIGVATADFPMGAVAVLDNVAANGSTAYSTTGTYSASSGRSAIIASYATSASAPVAYPFTLLMAQMNHH